jgi:hypothetical protein
VLIVVSVANVFNLGADIGAMAAATHLVVPGKVGVFTVIFGMASPAGVLLVPYSTYAKYLICRSSAGRSAPQRVNWEQVKYARCGGVFVPNLKSRSTKNAAGNTGRSLTKSISHWKA